MSSVLRRYAQCDNRVETVTLTGYISNNGFINGSDEDQHPAYAPIDLRKSNNFTIDTNSLTLRTDAGADLVAYMLNIYIDSVKPPLYYPNFEFNIIVNVKRDTSDPESIPLRMTIFANKEEAEAGYAVSNKLYVITNRDEVDESNTSGNKIMTFLVANNEIVLKSLSAGLFEA